MTPRIPLSPLTDAQWAALLPHVESRAPQGRPLHDLRGRMDAIFALVATDAPWRALPERHGKAGSVSRHFRRLTHAGVWEALLRALARARRRDPIRELEPVICRCARRACRLRGLGLIVLARRLGIRRALPGPSWLVPNPDLSETLHRLILARLESGPGFLLRWARSLRNLLTLAAGRRSIPRYVRLLAP